MTEPARGNILIARPLWPVLRRIGDLLSRRGYSVESFDSWNALLEKPGIRDGLAAVFLGEYGYPAEEEGVLRRFRDANRPGVPVFVVGGRSALRWTRRFREAGADMIIPADLAGEEILDRALPLLAYCEMYRGALSAGREMRNLWMVDELTGLPDRRRFSHDLERSSEAARRIGRPLSCIVTDIDNLRSINEGHGSAVGDGVIREFGDVLNRAKRRYDNVARLGGDEFVWLLLGVDGVEAVQAAERVNRLVSGTVFRGVGERLRVTATFGVASLTPGSEWNVDTLLEQADRALYLGKECGKNVVRFYPPGREVSDA